MIFIYNCFAGTHSSVLAASYHLKKLPIDRSPTKAEILNIELFNKLTIDDRGKFFYHGKDDEGNKVFTIGRGNSKILVPALYNFFKLLDEENPIEEKIIFSTTCNFIPLAMAVGGFTSVRLKAHFIGVPLLILGTKQTYKNIIRVVEYTKAVGAKTSNKVELIEIRN